jgi:predicted TIM-barrel fold metal-dependent hydrolase
VIVDFHIHIYSPSLCDDRSAHLADGQFRLIYSSPKAKLIDCGVAAAALEASNIDHAVAMGFHWDREDFCAEQNESLIKAFETTKGLIIPFGSVPLSCGTGIEPWVGELKRRGFAGVGEVAFYRDGLTPGNLEYLEELLDAARRHALPVCIHINEPVGHSYTGKYPPEFHRLYQALTNHPDAVVVLSHWGGGLIFYELMPEVSAKMKNCYYDTAASPFLFSDAIYDIGPRIAGSKKILFGSDFPLIPFRRYLESIENTVADPDTQYDMLGRNALSLLDIKG